MFKKKKEVQEPLGPQVQDIQTPESPNQCLNIDVKNL
jgi:hypothetical protein